MMALLLLLTFHGATEASTVTQTVYGSSALFPWPASGRVRISVPCSNGLPSGSLLLYRDKSWGGRINWFIEQKMLRIYCYTAKPEDFNTYYSFTHDCSGGDKITYTVQFTTGEIRILYEGLAVAVRKREGWCASPPHEWQLQSVGGPVTASDEG